MSDHIPFEIQSEIIKRLPVKSLVQFRSVSKQWKSLIDSPEFIKNYHINRTNPQYHLLVEDEIDDVRTYTSIIDDNTFPQQKFSVTAPEPLNLLRNAVTLGSVNGLVCFYGVYEDIELETKMVVLWNPSVRKSVGIPIPNVFFPPDGYTRIGFGVCCDTSDPKLVKINVVNTPSIWEVHVFTLSSRVWKTVYVGAPKSSDFICNHVFMDGIIYWCTLGRFIISFDLKSEKFGEVCLPERLPVVAVVKVNESLGLLKYYKEGEMRVLDVWMRKDGVNKPFTKLYTIKLEGKPFNCVLGFRNNGDVVMEMDDDDLSDQSQIEVYEPLSGRFNNVGISGRHCQFIVSSYMETLLLVDQSNSIIH